METKNQRMNPTLAMASTVPFVMFDDYITSNVWETSHIIILIFQARKSRFIFPAFLAARV